MVEKVTEPINDMLVQMRISEEDFRKYNLKRGELEFSELVELINQEYARNALLACNTIAEQTGLSQMSMEEINAEIKAVRNAKTHS